MVKLKKIESSAIQAIGYNPEKPLLNRQQVQHKSIDQIAKLLDPTQ